MAGAIMLLVIANTTFGFQLPGCRPPLYGAAGAGACRSTMLQGTATVRGRAMRRRLGNSDDDRSACHTGDGAALVRQRPPDRPRSGAGNRADAIVHLDRRRPGRAVAAPRPF
jgi:hypothetical protein